MEHRVCCTRFLIACSYYLSQVGFTQCPIAPQKSFTYRFRAELFGTTWYHAHYSSQYADGVVGPIVIYGPSEEDYDIDLGPILLSDYYHRNSREIVKEIVSARPGLPPPKPVSDNNLINGKMNFDCSTATTTTAKCFDHAGFARFKFQAGKRHRLRLINSGADAVQRFSIDGHKMMVIENDFVAVEPYETEVVTLGVGQRTDVIVEGVGSPTAAYWIRSNATCAESRQPSALAIVQYEQTEPMVLPRSTPWSVPDSCDNDPLEKTIPLYKMSPGAPEATYTLGMTVGQDESGVWLWHMNSSSFRADVSYPSLLQAQTGNLTFLRERNVINTGSAKSYLFVLNNKSPVPHPMHLHGHNMYILAVGHGVWDGSIVRPENPQRRDVQNVPANGYMVWQADADNPGSWAFHCHIAWHAAVGLTVDILEHPEQIVNLAVPDDVYRVCHDWRDAFATGKIELLDSGV
ncbi:hypothetical protein PV10_08492 [Exophiala mesophila]|uniref:Uncharacterized protein n=1 Tax=Exophiala mesophila TaxID=212818 RepID=A0A0D1WIZ7_EXOME|nr:uncharacterized protein PV10_08492 [Exophiala mesophila]KIV88855.1 hypothetical protein PV10_08492 [Exophiala mesophila]